MLFFLQYCIVLHLATQYFSTYWKAAFRVTPFLLVFGPTVSSGFVWHEHPLPIWSYTECWKSKRSGRSGICFAIDRSPYRFDWIAIWIRSDWRLASEETFSSGYIDKQTAINYSIRQVNIRCRKARTSRLLSEQFLDLFGRKNPLPKSPNVPTTFRAAS